jgi:hypothetical protein
MTDVWKSQDKKWCMYCKIFVVNNKPSMDMHEKGFRHQAQVRRYLKHAYKESEREKREQDRLKREYGRIERAAIKQEQQRQQHAFAPTRYDAYQDPSSFSMNYPTFPSYPDVSYGGYYSLPMTGTVEISSSAPPPPTTIVTPTSETVLINKEEKNTVKAYHPYGKWVPVMKEYAEEEDAGLEKDPCVKTVENPTDHIHHEKSHPETSTTNTVSSSTTLTSLFKKRSSETHLKRRHKVGWE